MVWGENAMSEAMKSIVSLWREAKDIPILLLGDAKACEAFTFEGIETREIDIDPFREVACRASRPDAVEFVHAKLFRMLYGLSTFDKTLYLDADTEFMASPEILFRLLDRWDFVLAETPDRCLLSRMVEEPEMEYTRVMFGGAWWLLYHNGGMFAWRRNQVVKRFFELWYEEWARFGSWDPQVALLRGLARSEMAFLTLPYTWNCNRREETRLVYHRYGSQAAQANIRPPRGEA